MGGNGTSVFGGPPEVALEAAVARARALSGVLDPLAELLVSGDGDGETEAGGAGSAPSTSHGVDSVEAVGLARYIDDSVTRTLEAMPFIKQLVLFGSNLDTRSYRLHLPSGTIIFDVAPEAIMDHKGSRLKREKTRPGCLHVQVPVPGGATLEDVEKLMGRRAFQGSRPSMWTLEGMEVSPPSLPKSHSREKACGIRLAVD